MDWSIFFRLAVTKFSVPPREFWQMTPVEFWWLFPKEEKPTGAMTKEWVEEMTKKYGDNTPRNSR